MTRTQWRRYQRSKKSIAASSDDKAVDAKGKEKLVENVRSPIKERLSLPPIEENHVGDDEMDKIFMDSEPDFDIACNVVSILPVENDIVSKVEKSEEDYNPENMEIYNPCVAM
jgi:hypothetical protein